MAPKLLSTCKVGSTLVGSFILRGAVFLPADGLDLKPKLS